MGLRRGMVALLPLLLPLQACTTVAPPERSVHIPFDLRFQGLRVSSEVRAGVLVISLTCAGAEPLTVRASVRRPVIGHREVTRCEIVSFREEAVCDGNVCRLVRVPVYRESTTSSPVYGVIDISASSVRLEPGQSGSIRLRIANAGEISVPFTLEVSLLIRAPGAGQLSILCDSTTLLASTS